MRCPCCGSICRHNGPCDECGYVWPLNSNGIIDCRAVEDQMERAIMRERELIIMCQWCPESARLQAAKEIFLGKS